MMICIKKYRPEGNWKTAKVVKVQEEWNMREIWT
jgi:hypothetical protein